jgi:molecular chaperone HtpG
MQILRYMDDRTRRYCVFSRRKFCVNLVTEAKRGVIMQPSDIKSLRTRLNWTQRDLADNLKVSLRTVQDMEAGKKRLTERDIKALQQIDQENPSVIAVRHLKMELDFHGLIKILAGHLYSKKEIFIRELIQNAHDAIWRRHHTDDNFDVGQGRIDLITDLTGGQGRIVFRDNGIGMRDSDLIEFLSAIGRSGTQAALEDVPEAIGQFGIGFLSGFVVAERIEVRTRHWTARPEEGCLWQSHGDQDYNISPVTLDRIGSEVTVLLKDASDRDLLHEDTLRGVITSYADMLKVAIHLNDPQHLRDSVNLRTMPWEREGIRPEEMRFDCVLYLEKRVPDSVLEVIPINEPDAQGLLYITKTRVLGLDVPRTVRVFLKRMFLCDSAVELLPKWATFVNGLINTTALEPNAARDRYIEDENFVTLRDRLGNLIIAHLDGLKVSDPARLAEILAYHDFTIKAACQWYDAFFEKFGHLLEWRINPGAPVRAEQRAWRLGPDWQKHERWITLGDLVAQLPPTGADGPKRLACFTTTSRQYFNMADAAGTTVIDASMPFEEELLKAWAKLHEREVSLIHVDRQDDPAVFRPVDDAMVRDLALIMSRNLARETAVRVEARAFDPADVTSVMRETEASEGLRKARSVLADANMSADMKRMAEDLIAMNRRAERRMYINAENPLVREIAALVRREPNNPDAEELLLGLYNAAVLAGARYIDPVFVAQFHRLLHRILTLAHAADALKQKERTLAETMAAVQPQSRRTRRHLRGFHITSFDPTFSGVGLALRQVMAETFRCELIRADRQKVRTLISDNVRHHIEDADFFVIDLTTPVSPNVMLEAGAVGYGRRAAPVLYIAGVDKVGDKPDLPADLQGLIVHPYVRSASAEQWRNDLTEACRSDTAFRQLLDSGERRNYISSDILHAWTLEAIEAPEARQQLVEAMPTLDDWQAADDRQVEVLLQPHNLHTMARLIRKMVIESKDIYSGV